MLGVKSMKISSGYRPQAQLLQDQNHTEEHDDDDIDWSLECAGMLDIRQYMNESGCFDDGTPLGDNFTEESAAQMIMPEFCNSCNATNILDMIHELDISCFANSEALKQLNMIVPVLAAMCTHNDGGELCVADFFLEMFLDDEEDDDSSSHGGEHANGSPGSPTEAESPVDSEEHMPWWRSVCDASHCPWQERMVAHQFDCDTNTDMMALKTLCIEDQDRMCVDAVVDFLESGNGNRMPTQFEHAHFCNDPCAGAVIEDMRANAMHGPQCMSDDEIPMDLSLACFQSNGSYCLPLVYEGMMGMDADEPEPEPEHEEHVGLNCTFADPMNVTSWGECAPECKESAMIMFAEYECCADVYMELKFGQSNVDAVYDWVEAACSVPRPEGEFCAEQFAFPRDTPQCKELRDNGVDVLGALKCLVHIHEGF